MLMNFMRTKHVSDEILSVVQEGSAVGQATATRLAPWVVTPSLALFREMNLFSHFANLSSGKRVAQ